MAILAKPLGKSLKLSLTATIDGKAKTVTKSFTNVKASATTENVYAVATELGNLQTLPVSSVGTIENMELSESM